MVVNLYVLDVVIIECCCASQVGRRSGALLKLANTTRAIEGILHRKDRRDSYVWYTTPQSDLDIDTGSCGTYSIRVI